MAMTREGGMYEGINERQGEGRQVGDRNKSV